VQAVVTKVAEKDFNLDKENRRFYGTEISTHKYLFDRQEKELAILSELSKKEIIDLYHKLFLAENVKRLDVMLNSAEHKEQQAEWKVKNNETYYKEKPRIPINETIATFKKKMGLHPDTYKANYATFKM